jgi:hypothetical protein
VRERERSRTGRTQQVLDAACSVSPAENPSVLGRVHRATRGYDANAKATLAASAADRAGRT